MSDEVAMRPALPTPTILTCLPKGKFETAFIPVESA